MVTRSLTRSQCLLLGDKHGTFNSEISKGPFTFDNPSPSDGPSDCIPGLFTAGSNNILTSDGTLGKVVGLFTHYKIKKDTAVAAYTGIPVARHVVDSLPPHPTPEKDPADYLHLIEQYNVYIMPYNSMDPDHRSSCTAAYANEAPLPTESYENNLRMRLLVATEDGTRNTQVFQCQLVASCDIPAFSELTWYYGQYHDRSAWYNHPNCPKSDGLCGNSRVSGSFSDFDKRVDHAQRGRKSELKFDLVTRDPTPGSFFSLSPSNPDSDNYVVTTMDELSARLGRLAWW